MRQIPTSLLTLCAMLSCLDADGAVFSVNNTSGSNSLGSLPAAVNSLNTTADPSNRILFSPEGSGTITLGSGLELQQSVEFVTTGAPVMLEFDPAVKYALTVQPDLSIALPEGLSIEMLNSTATDPSAIYSSGSLELTELAGTITTSASTHTSVVLVLGELRLGTFSGNIVTISNERGASTIFARYGIMMDEFTGSLIVDGPAADSDTGANGVYAGYEMIVSGDVGGTISVKGGLFGTAGLNLSVPPGETGTMRLGSTSGTIIADGGLAAGIIAHKGRAVEDGVPLIVERSLAGTILVTATQDGYGVLAQNGELSIGTAMSGAVEVEGTNIALGLAANGALYGADTELPLTLSGEVRASSSNQAAALLGGNGMNLRVTGTLEGLVNGSGHEEGAYAILAGQYQFGTISPFPGTITAPIAATDRVEVAESGRLVGRVDLGAGDDLFIVTDSADISAVPDLAGGDGADRLLVERWSGELPTTLSGWEQISVHCGSVADLGASKSILPSTGLSLLLDVEAGATLLATGNSPGLYHFEGDVHNDGLLEMRDGAGDDRISIAGSLTGSGSVGFDVELGTTGATRHDELLVTNTIAGTQQLLISNVSKGGVILPTSGKGIMLADVTGGDGGGVLVLDASNDFREAEVAVLRGGADGIGDDWYLVITHGAAPLEHQLLRAVLPLAWGLGLESLPGFREKQGPGWRTGNALESGWWSRSTGERTEADYASNEVETRSTGYSGTLQLGSDLWSAGVGGVQYRLGLYTNMAQSGSNVRNWTGSKVGEIWMDGLGLGAYASMSGPGAWYFEAQFQASRYEVDTQFAEGGYSADDAAMGYVLSLEGGRRLDAGRGVTLEPQMQLLWQSLDGFRLETRSSTGHAELADRQAVVARVGSLCELECPGWKVIPVVGVHLEHDFGGQDEINYPELGMAWEVERSRTRLECVAGLQYAAEKAGSLAWHVRGGLREGIDGPGSTESMIMAGITKSW